MDTFTVPFTEAMWVTPANTNKHGGHGGGHGGGHEAATDGCMGGGHGCRSSWFTWLIIHAVAIALLFRETRRLIVHFLPI